VAVDLLDSLFAVVDALDDEGIEHALVGGLALAVHGAPRATTDIDLIVPQAQVESERGRKLWVIGREALIAMKLSAGRPQDLADVARLQEADR
jgi:hypothetical protein